LQDAKEQIAAAIIRAQTDLDQALSDLEKLPPIDRGSVAFVAHALNNFLTVTEATVEFLMLSLTDHPDPTIHVWLENLKHATNLMTRAVSQLMNNTVAHDTKLRLEKVDVSLGLHRACAYYQSKAEEKQIRIICGPFVDVPPVWTDRVAAGAVLDNLISNALKYSPPGRNIHITLDKEQDSVICSVCDEGPGLSQEEQTQLFQRGVRLSPVPTGGESSTGYGLAVAKELVGQLGGSIWCVSEPGKGSCFSVRLPAYQEPLPGPEQTLNGTRDLSKDPI
jgi:two-component system sensor histidine kinase/response regulator